MMRTMRTSKKTTPQARGLREGYRSGLEEVVAAALKERGFKNVYETLKIHYVKPARESTYTPDFPLPNGIVVETKGRFTTEDRQKHKWIKEQHPDLDVRFVFSNSRNKLSKKSKTTYADWCNQYNFQYHDKVIPDDWLKEPKNTSALKALNQATKK